MADKLDIAGRLRKHQSRANVEAIVDYVGGDRERFAELYRVFDRGDLRMKQCAAWPISVVAENHPELVVPYLGKLIEFLPRTDVHNAVKRSVTRLLQFVDVPERLRGRVFNYCLDLTADPGEPIAVRCFAMTAAAKAACGQPELLRELRLVAEDHRDTASAGLRVRIRRLLSDQ